MPHSIFLDGMGRRAQDGKFAEFPRSGRRAGDELHDENNSAKQMLLKMVSSGRLRGGGRGWRGPFRRAAGQWTSFLKLRG